MRNCSIVGCGRKHARLGYCDKHAYRFKKFGDPLIAGRTEPGEVHEWLERHKDYRGDGCLIWPYAKLPDGYGRLNFRGLSMRASRAMCILAHGQPPSDLHQAAHSCGKGGDACVHPEHVRWATPVENMQDAVEQGTISHGEARPMAILTDVAVADIRVRVSQGEGQAALAREYNVSVGTLNEVVLYKTWKHVA